MSGAMWPVDERFNWKQIRCFAAAVEREDTPRTVRTKDCGIDTRRLLMRQALRVA